MKIKKTILFVLVIVFLSSVFVFGQELSSGKTDINPDLTGVFTVTFSDGSVYTGEFLNGYPQSCYGKYVYGDIVLDGYFEKTGETTVHFNNGIYEVTISVVYSSY